VLGQPLFDQGFILRREDRLIQVEGAANEQLPLGNRERG